MSDDRPRSADFVRSLARGLLVIRAFDAEHRELGLSDVARISGLPRAAARRSLLTLASLGYVTIAEGRFALTPRVLELGYAYLSSLTLPEVAQPHLEALVARVNESSALSVLDDTEVVCVARVATRRIIGITLSVGARLPAYATSMGRVLLAALPEAELGERLDRTELRPLSAHTISDRGALEAALERVRRQGWAAVDQELEEGLRSLAVPIHDAAGATVAALDVSVHAGRGTLTTMRREILPLARAAAAAIDADLRRAAASVAP